MWYCERKNFRGEIIPEFHADFPPDRTSDGVQRNFIVRKEIQARDLGKTLVQLSEIYGSHVPKAVFKSVRK